MLEMLSESEPLSDVDSLVDSDTEAESLIDVLSESESLSDVEPLVDPDTESE
jgi:predicted nucleotidyltransferase